MSDSASKSDTFVIYDLIRKHGLKPGDQMINIKGDPIENCTVLDNHSLFMKHDVGADLIMETPLSGEEIRVWFSDDALAQLKEVL